MPEFSGFDVMEALETKAADITIVAITADHNGRTCSDALRRGAAACLVKPVDDALLLDTIAVAIRSNLARRTP
jgi:FixJ family two-component response regulator